ncbi:MAG: 4-hydroxy-3-methylbut-2-enyl diphosphate reductase [Ignavibacteria bacterium]|jgi:4-hydroxy-3-methylbut-2-enyl diphosphate reductase|nr:4-hydroxy-3-methylbut-2-enyl diphosphate reductase [Ignavibacteria bacterium]MDH7527127.1 4-hydroxy-3-methylbut-2-enyl diphosphate reductase [Ignavibacteria bacterium]
MRKFNIPVFYKSSIITRLKDFRNLIDPKKKDLSPTELDFGPVKFLIARHFGFCYGVQNAIEISYKTLEENPDKRVFLLSEIIHNPIVNEDLLFRGINFIMKPTGEQIIPWEEITPDDIVLIPAFGTTVEIEEKLKSIGLQVEKYDTTCPFVEKVWNRSAALGEKGYTIIIHGKYKHEETRATFSHSVQKSHSVIVLNLEEAQLLGKIILDEIPSEKFYEYFKDKHSEGFDSKVHLERIGVVNQTTMLASETQEISDYFKSVMLKKYGEENLKYHFADTSDTLCYATYDNQEATLEMLKYPADFAVVIGGYNSSNTTHIVELCQEKLKTFFVSSEEKILSRDKILHYDINLKKEVLTQNYIPEKEKVIILLTSGASCPDSVIEGVLRKLHSFFPSAKSIEDEFEKLLIKSL